MTLSQLISEYKNLVLLYRLLTILHLLDSKQKSIKLEGNEDSIPSDPSLKKSVITVTQRYPFIPYLSNDCRFSIPKQALKISVFISSA